MRVPLAGQIVLANVLVLFVLIAGILAFQPAWPVPAQLWLIFAAAFGVCIALSLALATAITRPLAALAAVDALGLTSVTNALHSLADIMNRSGMNLLMNLQPVA
mgnify:CR=1 FL=1